MGSQRSGKRQHLYLSFACLILLAGAACAPRLRTPPGPPLPEVRTRGHMERVSGFIDRADFEGAMRACRNLLSRSPNEPRGAEALLIMGLLSAHYANPKKDYQQAAGYFTRLEREFPRSPLAEEARIWISVLETFEKTKQIDIEIEQKKRRTVKEK